jgi:hypothetical protein
MAGVSPTNPHPQVNPYNFTCTREIKLLMVLAVGAIGKFQVPFKDFLLHLRHIGSIPESATTRLLITKTQEVLKQEELYM